MDKKVPCEVFCRIVGYYRPLHNWNQGKVEEFYDRKLFKVNEKSNPVPSCGCSEAHLTA